MWLEDGGGNRFVGRNGGLLIASTENCDNTHEYDQWPECIHLALLDSLRGHRAWQGNSDGWNQQVSGTVSGVQEQINRQVRTAKQFLRINPAHSSVTQLSLDFTT
ncbi:MAG: hypothetical protein HC933_12310 [Pleurocapsa sp. SU_196_0]|nr:hypothetical protein [Pleurocapsa sp. SU_196_0]